VTPVWVTIQHAVISGPANSQLEPCVIRAVRHAAQVIANWRQQQSYAGSPRMIGAIRPNIALVARQRVRRISLSRTVRTHCPSVLEILTFSKGQKCGSGGLACANGICTSLDCGFPSCCKHQRRLTALQYNASRRVPRSG
jgi:hypothetical protein